jgi:hypothetical protein
MAVPVAIRCQVILQPVRGPGGRRRRSPLVERAVAFRCWWGNRGRSAFGGYGPEMRETFIPFQVSFRAGAGVQV